MAIRYATRVLVEPNDTGRLVVSIDSPTGDDTYVFKPSLAKSLADQITLILELGELNVPATIGE